MAKTRSQSDRGDGKASKSSDLGKPVKAISSKIEKKRLGPKGSGKNVKSSSKKSQVPKEVGENVHGGENGEIIDEETGLPVIFSEVRKIICPVCHRAVSFKSGQSNLRVHNFRYHPELKSTSRKAKASNKPGQTTKTSRSHAKNMTKTKAAQPVPQTAPQPATQPATTPATTPVTQPATTPATTPATQPATQPVTRAQPNTGLKTPMTTRKRMKFGDARRENPVSIQQSASPETPQQPSLPQPSTSQQSNLQNFGNPILNSLGPQMPLPIVCWTNPNTGSPFEPLNDERRKYAIVQKLVQQLNQIDIRAGYTGFTEYFEEFTQELSESLKVFKDTVEKEKEVYEALHKFTPD